MKQRKRLSAETKERLAHDMLIASKDGFYPVGDVQIKECATGYWDKWGRNHDQSHAYYYIYCEKDV